MRYAWAVAAGVFWAAAPALAQAPEPAADVSCLHAGTLIAEPGKPAAKEQTIKISAGRIVAVEAGYQSAGCARVIDLKSAHVLPGIIDAHVHITSEQGPMGRLDTVTKSAAQRAFDGAKFAQRTLMAGVTTAADLGAQDPDSTLALRDAIDAGIVPGPRLLVAGRAITPSGGHGDVNGFRQDVMGALRMPNACNGADDCRRATREMIQRGIDIVKVTATGGVLSNTDAGLAQQLTDAELKAIVETAHAMKRKVVAHAHGLDGVNAALRAGVDAIEHGTYADATSFELFKKSGTVLSPTIIAGVFVGEEAAKPNTYMPAPVRKKALEVGGKMIETTRLARNAGVTIVFGTDTGVSPHGQNLRELQFMVKAGFSPAEALRAGTVGSAKHLGLENETGRIAPGLAADIIAVKADPLKDVAAMMDVNFVMARGLVAKGG